MKKNYFFAYLLLSCFFMNAQSVSLLKDINPTGDSDDFLSSEKSMIEFNGNLYFTADNGTNGNELWKYDGINTELFLDINPGDADSNCSNFFIINNKLIFTADNGTNGIEWWVTDGTTNNTQLVKDIYTGTSDGVYFSSFSSLTNFIVFNDSVFFTGYDEVNGYELWSTDGTEEGTILVKNIESDTDSFISSSFPQDFAILNNNVLFSCRDGLWKTDGTEAGTVAINSDIDPADLVTLNDKIILWNNSAIWTTDGTTEGTIQIKTLNRPSTNNSNELAFTVINGKAFFAGSDDVNGAELWITDGTETGTHLILDATPGTDGYAPQNKVVFKDKLYYKGNNGQDGIELWTSDGTSAGTFMVKDIASGSNSGFVLPSEIYATDDYIFMSAGNPFNTNLWISDGTESGTEEIIITDDSENKPRRFFSFNEGVLFFALNSNSIGRELHLFSSESNVYIPDATFKAILVENTAINTNGDTEISYLEAEAFTDAISIYNTPITDVTGLEAFINISELLLYNCSIESIDLSKNTSLTELTVAYNNNLASIDLSENTELIKVNISGNNLTSVDISKNISLTDLAISSNNLTSVDVSINTLLTTLSVSSNELESIDISKNTLLTNLDISNNKLTDIDLSNNIELTNLDLIGNRLTSINTSNNIKLNTLSIGRNNLTTIDLSKNLELSYFSCILNDLTALDISENLNLTTLICRDNKLTTLSIESNLNLTSLDCSTNNLRSLSINNGSNTTLTSLNVTENALSCIQVDDVSFAENNVNWFIDDYANYNLNCENSSEEIVYIPDENFKNYLVSNPDINLDGDTEIQKIEANFTTESIDVDELSINNLIGIEEFINIRSLYCSKNNISSLDISNNTQIKSLFCNNNNLTELDVSNNPLIHSLSCYSNNIASLDVSNLNLFQLHCYENSISSLDVSNSTDLYSLTATDNLLTEIDISKNINLSRLNCGSNNIKTLDLSNNTSLEQVFCENNSISTLDFSLHPELTRLQCGDNNLQELDLSLNSKLTYFHSSSDSLTSLNIANGNNENITLFSTRGNDNLYCIKVDDVAYSEENWANYIDDNSSFSTVDCSSIKKLIINESTNGVVTANPSSDNEFYDNNTQVTLTATPNEGYQFDGWEGYDETTNSLTITMDQDRIITAIFSETSTASINDESFANKINIYPNPADSFIKVETTDSSNILEIKITNLLGKEILVTNKKSIAVSYLSPGVYILKIKDDNNKMAIKKFIKE